MSRLVSTMHYKDGSSRYGVIIPIENTHDEYAQLALKKLYEYECAEAEGRLKKLPCKLGDPLYFISDEDDDGNDIPSVKEVDGGIRAIIITDAGIRVADYAELAQIVNYSNEIGTRYAYPTRERAEMDLKGAGE